MASIERWWKLWGVPPDDRFQVITEHAPGGMVYDPQYLGIQRTDRVVFVQITLSTGRKPMQKRKFYKRMAELLNRRVSIQRNW